MALTAAELEIVLKARDDASKALDAVKKKADDLGNAGKSASSALGASLTQIGSSATSAGKSLSMGVTAPIVGLGTAAAKMAGDFESQMNILTVAARSSGTSLADLSKAALSVGADTELVGITAAESADAMTSLYKAGFDTAEIFGGAGGLNSYLNENASLTGALRSSIDLAAASELDLAQATDATIIAMKTFGLDADEASRVANSFVRTADASVASVSDLTAAMANIGPTAATFGMSLETTNTALGILSSRGIAGAEAGTALKSMLTNMMRTTDDVTGAWNMLGIAMYDADGKMRAMPDILAELSEALTVGNVLTSERAALTAEEAKQLEKLEGKREELAKKDLAIRNGTLMGNATLKEREAELNKVDKALEETVLKMEGLKQKEGQTVTVTTKMTEELRNQTVQTLAGTYGMKAMNTLLTEGAAGWKNMETAVGAAATVEESAAARTTGFNAAMEQLGGALETIAIKAGGPIITALTALLQGPISGLLDKISNLNPAVWDWALKIGLVLAAVGPLLMVLGTLLSTVGSAITVFTALAPILAGAGAAIGALLGPILLVIGVIALLAVAWSNNWGGIREIAASALAFIQGLIQAALAAITGWWAEHGAQVMGVLNTLWQGIQSVVGVGAHLVQDIIGTVLALIRGDWEGAWEGIKLIVFDKLEMVKGVIITVMETIAGIFGVNTDRAKEIVNTAFSFIMDVVLDTMGAVSNFVTGTLIPILQTIWDWLAANIPVAIQALAGFWTGTLLPAIQSVGSWITGTLVPILQEIWNWLATNIPAAIQAVSVFWTGTLLPAIQAVGNWITGTLVPVLQQVWDWLSTNIPAAISTVSGFWTDTLLPAIQAVGDWINENLIPLFEAIVDVWFAAMDLALTALAGLWQNVLLPAIQDVGNWLNENLVPALKTVVEWLADKFQIALEAVGNFINDTVLPAIKDLAEWFKDKLLPAVGDVAEKVDGPLKSALEWLKDKLLEPLKTALGTMGDKIQDVTKFFQGFADKLDALKGRLPKWLTPGSPTPLETGLVGIGEALDQVVQEFVKFGSKLGGSALNNLNRFGLAVRDIAKTMKDLASAMHQMNKVEKTEGGIPNLELWANALKESIIRFSRAITEAAKEVKTSTINNAKELAGKIEQIFELLRTLGSVLNDLKGLETIPDMAPFGAALQQAIVVTATAINNAALQLGEKGLKAAAKLSDDAQKIIGLIGPAVSALGSMADMKEATDLRGSAIKLEEALNIFIYYVNRVAMFWEGVALDAAATFAETAQKVIALIGPAVSALAGFVDFPAVGNLHEKSAFLEEAINLFVYYVWRCALFFEGVGLDSAVTFSEAAQKIIALIKPAVDALAAMAEYKPVENLPAMMVTFKQDLFNVVEAMRSVALAFGTEMMKAASETAQAMTAVIALVKPGVDALAAMAAYTPLAKLPAAMVQFKQDLFNVVDAMRSVALAFETEAMKAAGETAQAIIQVVALIKPGIDAIKELGEYETVKKLPAILDVFKMDLFHVVEAIRSVAMAFETEATAAAAGIATSITTILGMVKPAIDTIKDLAGYTAAKGLTAAMTKFETDLKAVVNKLGEIATSLGGDAGIGKAQAFATAATAIKAAIDTGLGTLSSLSGGGATGAASALTEFAKTARQGMKDAVQALKDAAPQLSAALEGVPGAIWDIFASFDWGNIGYQLAKGIAAGITAGTPAIKAAAKAAAQAALDSAKKTLSVASPSKRARLEVGQMFGRGLALGITDTIGRIQAAMTEMSAAMTIKPQVAYSGARARTGQAAMTTVGGATYNLNYIDQRPNGGPADMRAVAESLEWRARMRRY